MRHTGAAAAFPRQGCKRGHSLRHLAGPHDLNGNREAVKGWGQGEGPRPAGNHNGIIKPAVLSASSGRRGPLALCREVGPARLNMGKAYARPSRDPWAPRLFWRHSSLALCFNFDRPPRARPRASPLARGGGLDACHRCHPLPGVEAVFSGPGLTAGPFSSPQGSRPASAIPNGCAWAAPFPRRACGCWGKGAAPFYPLFPRAACVPKTGGVSQSSPFPLASLKARGRPLGGIKGKKGAGTRPRGHLCRLPAPPGAPAPPSRQ